MTKIELRPKLKPCPCCDQAAVYEVTITENTTRCTNCGLRITRDNDDRQRSFIAWNLRMLESAATARIAELEAFMESVERFSASEMYGDNIGDQFVILGGLDGYIASGDTLLDAFDAMKKEKGC